MAEQKNETQCVRALIQKWHIIVLQADVTQEEILAALKFCQATTRLTRTESGVPTLEVAVEDDHSAADFQQRLAQAIADQRLRQAIQLKASPDLTAFVDDILRRAVGS